MGGSCNIPKRRLFYRIPNGACMFFCLGHSLPSICQTSLPSLVSIQAELCAIDLSPFLHQLGVLVYFSSIYSLNQTVLIQVAKVSPSSPFKEWCRKSIGMSVDADLILVGFLHILPGDLLGFLWENNKSQLIFAMCQCSMIDHEI